ncbi:MAG: PD40 domain-containing protein [Deltaproteobacteria bacterium]|nr:PD40 domain-containing protein [Deltaproteobacteria bacterium]
MQDNPYSRTGDSRLFILDVVGGEPEVLEGVTDGVQPNWSPNGHRIAYWGLEVGQGQRDLWTIPATGGEPVRVTNDEAIDFSPVWSPDGSWIYFASTRGGSMAIWRVAVDEQSGTTRGEPQPITTGGLTEPGMLSLSADGSKLLYTATATRGTIFAAAFDPDTLQLASDPVALVEGSRRIHQAEVSHDGTRLVYRTGGAQQDLYVTSVDDGREQQITNDAAKDWAPRWSPADDRIAYYSNQNGFYEVWVVQPDGTRPTRLTDIPDDNMLRPTWSPDGTKIIFSVRIKTPVIIDADVGYAEQTMVELPKISGHEDTWFRASDWRQEEPSIVGESSGVGEFSGVWVYDTQTREFEQLVEGVAAIGSTWLADGRRILYRVPSTGQLFVVDRISKQRWEVDAPGAESVVLSADNRRIYLVQEEAESDIWLAELGQGR